MARLCGMVLGLALTATAVGQVGVLEVREIDGPVTRGEPILREDFERCEPTDAVLRDERKPDTWVLRTVDWPTPLLNATGQPPDLTYDPQLAGVYDIHLGTRATDFTVSLGMKLASEDEFTVITCPRETKQVHQDWEYCFRREVALDGEKIVMRALGSAVYVDYLKFVPILTSKRQARVAGGERRRHDCLRGRQTLRFPRRGAA